MFARNLLPHRLAQIIPKADAPIRLRLGQKNSPAIFRHAHESIRGPPFGVDGGCRAQVNVSSVEIAGAEAMPPV